MSDPVSDNKPIEAVEEEKKVETNGDVEGQEGAVQSEEQVVSGMYLDGSLSITMES